MIPCWRIEVRHERMSGALGKFLSRPLTYTEAIRRMRDYERTGHPVRLVEIPEMTELSRLVARRELYEGAAMESAKQQGLL